VSVSVDETLVARTKVVCGLTPGPFWQRPTRGHRAHSHALMVTLHHREARCGRVCGTAGNAAPERKDFRFHPCPRKAARHATVSSGKTP